MLKNIPGLSSLATLIFLFSGCTKIDTTTLGADLIPAVDNVHTFADTLPIISTQGFFNDTTRVTYTDLHPVGSITNDPLFGKTKADLYVQLKPSFFPFYYGNKGDTIVGFDSVVLCLSYKSIYGDSTMPQSFSVYKINSATTNFKDSSYFLNFLPDMGLGSMIGSSTILPTDLRKYTFFKGSRKDSINNQIRIKLDPSFLTELISNLDTSSASTGIYRSDSLFKLQMKGLAVMASGTQGNALLYTSLTDAATRLEVHYRKQNKTADTAFASFTFAAGINPSFSAQATHLERDWSTGEISAPIPDAVYLQTTPGTYARLDIPGLAAYSNRIIHRAEIVAEEIPSLNPIDKNFGPPLYLYLDLVDTPSSANKYKPVYYDLNPNTAYYPDDTTYFYPSGGIDHGYFGAYLRKKASILGQQQYYYTFNVSRYVQHIVTNDMHNYPFRLFAPAKLYYSKYVLNYNNLIGEGRLRIGDGKNANYKMYMRVVYSKI